MNSVSQINVLKILVDIMQNPIWSIVMMYIQSPLYFRKVKKKKKKKKNLYGGERLGGFFLKN